MIVIRIPASSVPLRSDSPRHDGSSGHPCAPRVGHEIPEPGRHSSMAAQPPQDTPKTVLRILRCPDKAMWYANMIGKTVPYLGRYPEAYKSRQPEGYSNIVHFTDAEVISEFEARTPIEECSMEIDDEYVQLLMDRDMGD